MSSTIPVGVLREPEPVHDVRTPAQRAAVLALAAKGYFAYACSNPFGDFTAERVQARGSNFECPFWLLWYDMAGLLHATRFGKDGRVLRELVGNDARRASFEVR